MADTKLSLTLLIDTSSKKVLFAEAGKDFVDFLFYLLALPLGTVTGLLRQEGMVGSLGNLYESIENLSQTYFLPSKDKDLLLRPYAPALIESPLLLTNEAQHAPTSSKKFYICSGCNICISDDPSLICPTCRQQSGSNFFGTHQQSGSHFFGASGSSPFGTTHHSAFGATGCRKINTEVRYIAPEAVRTSSSSSSSSSSDEGGLVKGMVTYMVMDDLVVKPMSTISTITLLNKFKVKDVGALEEKVVDFAMAEVCNSTMSSVILQTTFNMM